MDHPRLRSGLAARASRGDAVEAGRRRGGRSTREADGGVGPHVARAVRLWARDSAHPGWSLRRRASPPVRIRTRRISLLRLEGSARALFRASASRVIATGPFARILRRGLGVGSSERAGLGRLDRALRARPRFAPRACEDPARAPMGAGPGRGAGSRVVLGSRRSLGAGAVRSRGRAVELHPGRLPPGAGARARAHRGRRHLPGEPRPAILLHAGAGPSFSISLAPGRVPGSILRISDGSGRRDRFLISRAIFPDRREQDRDLADQGDAATGLDAGRGHGADRIAPGERQRPRGYWDVSGACDFNIAIRTIVVEGGAARFHAGGGIVADSTPEGEYEETLVKARGMMRALGTRWEA